MFKLTALVQNIIGRKDRKIRIATYDPDARKDISPCKSIRMTCSKYSWYLQIDPLINTISPEQSPLILLNSLHCQASSNGVMLPSLKLRETQSK